MSNGVCTQEHAARAWGEYQEFLRQPGPIVVGAAVCLADFGDTGAAFVALPQIPPRNVTWTGVGKWVHLAKVAFEKYFLRKVRTGSVTPVYERYVLKALGIMSLKRTGS